MININHLLTQALAENHYSIDVTCQQKLVHYLKLIQTWNRVFNLTAIENPRDMVYLHILDSLAITPFLHGSHFLDVGSGAGLPGIPLAIVNPEQYWLLLDKNSKKTRFLTQVIADLKLTNVEVRHARAQDFQASKCFDSIVSRAFGTLRMFVETTQHLICPDGLFLAMKGKYPEEELADLPESILVQTTKPLTIKGIDAERHIVCLEKNPSVT